MTEFDDLNKALATLKSRMDKATTATEAVNRLGATSDAMQKNAATVETRLRACEQGIAAIDKSIRDFRQAVTETATRTSQQWQDATGQVLERSGQSYVATVTEGLRKAGSDFSSRMGTLGAEWLKAFAALQVQMEKATKATEAVHRLGATTDSIQNHAAAMETRLQACEQGLAAIDKSIRDFQLMVTEMKAQSAQEWQQATEQALERSGQTYSATVTKGLQKAGKDFAGGVEALRTEWLQREMDLKRSRKWNWLLGVAVVALLFFLGLATGIIPK